MGLRERLPQDLHDAMRARDVTRRETIRLLQAAIKNAEIERRGPLDEMDIVALVQKQINQRRESVEQFRKGGRTDLAEREEAEMAVLEQYLPPQMSREDVAEAARAMIAKVGAQGPKEKGKIIGPLMADLRGRVDGRLVNEVVTELLGG